MGDKRLFINFLDRGISQSFLTKFVAMPKLTLATFRERSEKFFCGKPELENMSKFGRTLFFAVVFDAIVGFLFVGFNSWLWGYINGQITQNLWGPFTLSIARQTIIDGRAETIGLTLPIPNYPFILFWVAIVGNLIIIALSARSNK